MVAAHTAADVQSAMVVFSSTLCLIKHKDSFYDTVEISENLWEPKQLKFEFKCLIILGIVIHMTAVLMSVGGDCPEPPDSATPVPGSASQYSCCMFPLCSRLRSTAQQLP